jgi:hypothetical protein
MNDGIHQDGQASLPWIAADALWAVPQRLLLAGADETDAKRTPLRGFRAKPRFVIACPQILCQPPDISGQNVCKVRVSGVG